MLQQLLIITLTWNTLTSWRYLQCWPWLLSPATIWQHLQRLPVLPSTKEFYHPGQRKFIKRSFSLKWETVRYSTWLECQQSLHEESSLGNDWREIFKLIWGKYPLFNTASTICTSGKKCLWVNKFSGVQVLPCDPSGNCLQPLNTKLCTLHYAPNNNWRQELFLPCLCH